MGTPQISSANFLATKSGSSAEDFAAKWATAGYALRAFRPGFWGVPNKRRPVSPQQMGNCGYQTNRGVPNKWATAGFAAKSQTAREVLILRRFVLTTENENGRRYECFVGFLSSLALLNTSLLILVAQNRPKIPGATRRIPLGGFPYFGANKLLA